MPLRSEFKATPIIVLGYNVPTLGEQCANEGLALSDPDLWEGRHRAWALLRIGGFLTDAESVRIGQRIIDALSLSVGFEDAVRTLQTALAKQAADSIEDYIPPHPDDAPPAEGMLGLVDKWVHQGGPDSPAARFEEQGS